MNYLFSHLITNLPRYFKPTRCQYILYLTKPGKAANCFLTMLQDEEPLHRGKETKQILRAITVADKDLPEVTNNYNGLN